MSPPLGDPTDPETARQRKNYRGSAPRKSTLEKVGNFLRENQWFWALAFLALLLAVYARHARVQPPPFLSVGAVVQKEIRAPFDLQIQDQVATRQKREEAAGKVSPLYDWDSEDAAVLGVRVQEAFANGRKVLLEGVDTLRGTPLSREQRRAEEERVLSDLQNALGGGLSRFALRQLQADGLSSTSEELVLSTIAGISRRKIVADGDALPKHATIRVRDIRRNSAEWEQRDPGHSEIVTLSTARRLPGGRMEESADLPNPLRGALEEYCRSLLHPNLTFNSQETAKRQDAAAAQVEPLVVFVKKGQLLAASGDVVDESVRQKLEAFRSASPARLDLPALLAVSLFLLFLLSFLFMYLKSYRKQKALELNLFVLLLQVLLLFVLLAEGMLSGIKALAGAVPAGLFASPEAMVFLVPVAAGAVLVTLLVDKNVALVYAVAYAVLFGLLRDADFRVMLYAFFSGLVGIYAAVNLAQRAAQWRASLLLGGASALLALAVLAGNPSGGAPASLGLGCGLAFLSGFPITAMLVTPLLPVFENAYGILTEVRLLQLSNMNHPLLKRLALDAPGTYNHSVMMATLSEAAANAVGANGLFCRVASYYHDIGKILNPLYFVENQLPGQNPHDKLTPRVSSLIIAAHVKEGIALARQYHLPKAVFDVIPQHHGTRKIHYFFEKALTLQNPEKGEIQEGDFRYPGPKPQNREAAIIMMADGVEAASRLLKDPSPQRLKGLIEEINERVVAEGQLDECDLTFKDLSRVQDAFYQMLIGVFSRRISYPGYRFDKEEPGVAETGGNPA